MTGIYRNPETDEVMYVKCAICIIDYVYDINGTDEEVAEALQAQGWSLTELSIVVNGGITFEPALYLVCPDCYSKHLTDVRPDQRAVINRNNGELKVTIFPRGYDI